MALVNKREQTLGAVLESLDHRSDPPRPVLLVVWPDAPPLSPNSQLGVASSVEPVCIILLQGPRAECCVLSKASKRLPLNRAPGPCP